jgi:hypothetical protein
MLVRIDAPVGDVLRADVRRVQGVVPLVGMELHRLEGGVYLDGGDDRGAAEGGDGEEADGEELRRHALSPTPSRPQVLVQSSISAGRRSL